MKIFTAVLFAFALICGTVQLNGQELSKDEKKEWKNKAKEYKKNPAALKELTEERNEYRKTAQEAEAKMANMQAMQAQAQARMTELEQQNNQLSNELMMARQTIDQLKMEMASTPPAPAEPETPSEDYSAGVVYRVQVGAFSPGKVPAKYQGAPDVTIEDAGNVKKVLIGNYRSYDEAKAKVSELKSQGMKSPWIVPFKNGMRVSLKEARGY